MLLFAFQAICSKEQQDYYSSFKDQKSDFENMLKDRNIIPAVLLEEIPKIQPASSKKYILPLLVLILGYIYYTYDPSVPQTMGLLLVGILALNFNMLKTTYGIGKKVYNNRNEIRKHIKNITEVTKIAYEVITTPSPNKKDIIMLQ